MTSTGTQTRSTGRGDVTLEADAQRAHRDLFISELTVQFLRLKRDRPVAPRERRMTLGARGILGQDAVRIANHQVAPRSRGVDRPGTAEQLPDVRERVADAEDPVG